MAQMDEYDRTKRPTDVDRVAESLSIGERSDVEDYLSHSRLMTNRPSASL